MIVTAAFARLALLLPTERSGELVNKQARKQTNKFKFKRPAELSERDLLVLFALYLRSFGWPISPMEPLPPPPLRHPARRPVRAGKLASWRAGQPDERIRPAK